MRTEPILTALVIGCGRIAGGSDADDAPTALNHAAAYHRHNRFQLTGCVDPDGQNRDAFAEKWNVGKRFATLADAFANGSQWDVVSVCSPTSRHSADLYALLQTPVRAVWCEKPLTLSIGESRKIVDAYARTEKQLAVNYLRRWHPAMKNLRHQICSGEFGVIRCVIGFYTKGVRHNGSHLVDLIRFLLGPLKPVPGGVIVTDARASDPEDPTVDALLVTSQGAPVHLASSDKRDYALFELEIIGAAGSVRIERSGRAIRVRRPVDDPDEPGYRILNDGILKEIGTGDMFLRALDNLYQAVTAGAPIACNGATAIVTEEICDTLIAMAQKRVRNSP